MLKCTTTMRYTTTTLKKIEEIFSDIDYIVRYEKGNFQSGYCLVENRRIAVVNKFFDTEARINTLMEILNTLAIDPDALPEKARDLIKKWEAASDE